MKAVYAKFIRRIYIYIYICICIHIYIERERVFIVRYIIYMYV